MIFNREDDLFSVWTAPQDVCGAAQKNTWPGSQEGRNPNPRSTTHQLLHRSLNLSEPGIPYTKWGNNACSLGCHEDQESTCRVPSTYMWSCRRSYQLLPQLLGIQPPWPLAVGQEGLFVPTVFPISLLLFSTGPDPTTRLTMAPTFLLWMPGGAPIPAPRLLHRLSPGGKAGAGGLLLNTRNRSPSSLDFLGPGRELTEEAPPPPGIAWVSQGNRSVGHSGLQSRVQEPGVGCCPQAGRWTLAQGPGLFLRGDSWFPQFTCHKVLFSLRPPRSIQTPREPSSSGLGLSLVLIRFNSGPGHWPQRGHGACWGFPSAPRPARVDSQ